MMVRIQWNEVMEKIFFWAVILFFLVVCPQAKAAFWDTKPKEKAPVKITPVKTVLEPSAVSKKIEAHAKEVLAAKDWKVYFTPIEGKKNVMEMDVLTFSEGRFTSKNLGNKGYLISNFTITVSENSAVIWETVQTAENGDMAAWKGQLDADVMSGILSIHTLKGKLEDYYFTLKQ